MLRKALQLLLLVFGLASHLALGASYNAEGPHVKVSLMSSSSTVVAGQPLSLAVRIVAEPGWHTY